MFPPWLDTLCTCTLVLGLLCAIAILTDILRRPPKMRIMSVVWPVSALFGTILVLWFYIGWGREKNVNPRGKAARSRTAGKPQPFPIVVARGTLHCGAGCTLGDIVAEWLAFAVPGFAVVFGWHSLFAERAYAVWLLDFAVAFVFGILFQYFAIAPMRQLSVRQGIVAALKADTLSLAAWQIGMYCLMAYLQFVVFENSFHGPAPVNSVEFWSEMQLSMLAGFVTSYPMNWWLIRAGIKESM